MKNYFTIFVYLKIIINYFNLFDVFMIKIKEVIKLLII